MTAPGGPSPGGFQDALLAARLCAIEPGLGGMVLRGGGELRDEVIAALRRDLPADAPLRRLPAHVDDERLLGGIDLFATLARAQPVSRRGLLAETDGGILIVPMAERLSAAAAGRIAAAIDTGEVAVERDGVAMHNASRFAVMALDDGLDPDERAPSALVERLAFWIDLTHRQQAFSGTEPAQVPRTDEEVLTTLTATAAMLGIDSARATLFALHAARASARLAGRAAIADADVMLAARLVLAPRATRIPTREAESRVEAPPLPTDGGEGDREQGGPLEDIVLAAALTALPNDVLARLSAGRGRGTTRASGAGERRASGARGRPMGARAGVPGGGRRLSLIDTLRAAAPWQRLRGDASRIRVRRDDLRVRRFESRAQALTIFAVDASGSAALARLAEAKGAIELLLAEAYVKRAEVALVAFRGVAADLLLPPTRSLARARRLLAELPGGGGTPLAAGLNAARELAESGRARGRTPFVVVLTDGRANIAADGGTVRAAAEADAKAAARAMGATGIAAAFVDTSTRPRPDNAALAAAMGARYLPLPRADASTMHAAVKAAQAG